MNPKKYNWPSMVREIMDTAFMPQTEVAENREYKINLNKGDHIMSTRQQKVAIIGASVLLAVILGCGNSDRLSSKDTRLKFGEHAFAEITKVDKTNPRKVLLEGIAETETRGSDGSLRPVASPGNLKIEAVLSEEDTGKGKDTAIVSTSLPGAVIVVGVPDGVTIGEKHFGFRQILLFSSNFKYILAPPGMELTIPADIEILGKSYGKGKLIVPDDSRIPK